MWSLWEIVNLSWSLNQNFQGEFCHCFSVIADATAAAAAAAKGRQNGGGGEQKSYRVTISAPIIFHCRSSTYKTRRRNFSNEWVWKNTILRSGDAILWTCDKYLILQANREKFATWSHPPAAPPPPPPPPSAAAAMLAPTLLKNWYTLFAQSDYSVPKRVHFLIKKINAKNVHHPLATEPRWMDSAPFFVQVKSTYHFNFTLKKLFFYWKKPILFKAKNIQLELKYVPKYAEACFHILIY